jgi:hypothetical protein
MAGKGNHSNGPDEKKTMWNTSDDEGWKKVDAEATANALLSTTTIFQMQC